MVVALYDPPGNSGAYEENVDIGGSNATDEEGSTPSMSPKGPSTPSISPEVTPTPSMSSEGTPTTNRSILGIVNDFLGRLLEIVESNPTPGSDPSPGSDSTSVTGPTTELNPNPESGTTSDSSKDRPQGGQGMGGPQGGQEAHTEGSPTLGPHNRSP